MTNSSTVSHCVSGWRSRNAKHVVSGGGVPQLCRRTEGKGAGSYLQAVEDDEED